jgi:tRNA threonylcarbamoyladenosine biosynthesis protein TsaB
MSLLLHINTALGNAMTGFSRDNDLIASRENARQKDHASFLQPAIREMAREAGIKLADIDGVTVVNGPGSYTGLRVGLSAAKGICFSLRKPLITISTLEWMALPFRDNSYDFICPVIDARRMEVFTATYDRNLKCISSPAAIILDEYSFTEWLEKGTVLFTGNAVAKMPEILTSNANAVTSKYEPSLIEQVKLGTQAYDRKMYSDLAYTEPFYIKPFFSGNKVLM